MPFKERNHKFTGQSMSGVNFKEGNSKFSRSENKKNKKYHKSS